MNDSFLMQYIRQRMEEMGHKKFHFEPVRIFINASSTQLQAYNEYYYLINENIPTTVVITSDTNIFNEAADYANFTYYRTQEFSGLIEIQQAAAPIDLQFIKVIPE